MIQKVEVTISKSPSNPLSIIVRARVFLVVESGVSLPQAFSMRTFVSRYALFLVLEVIEKFHGPVADYVTLLGPFCLSRPDPLVLQVPGDMDPNLLFRHRPVHRICHIINLPS